METFGDVIGALTKVFVAPPGTDTGPLIEAYVSIAKKYHVMVEKSLENHSGKFAAGNQVTIADFVMASYVGNYVVNPAFPAFE